MEFFSPIHFMLAAVIGAIMQLLKGSIPKRLRPIIPFLIGFALAALATVIEYGNIPVWPLLISNILWKGIIGAVLSMAGYDVVKAGFMGGARDADIKVGGTDPGD